MPELPEVETFVRGLNSVVHARITNAEILDDRLRLQGECLSGAVIQGIRRRGKYIVIQLAGRGDLVVHLRMSGHLRLERSDREVAYTRMILHLEDGREIFFVNPRRLGTVVHCEKGFALPLGDEPLEATFTPARFAELATASRAPIKSLLLDQRKIAGIGNIYAAEALWRAGIDPRREAKSLGAQEATALHQAIVTVLSEAVDQLGTTIGTSISDYRPTAESGGSFQNHLAVYGREGKPCERCETKIQRVVQAGRSTCFCPACQN